MEWCEPLSGVRGSGILPERIAGVLLVFLLLISVSANVKLDTAVTVPGEMIASGTFTDTSYEEKEAGEEAGYPMSEILDPIGLMAGELMEVPMLPLPEETGTAGNADPVLAERKTADTGERSVCLKKEKGVTSSVSEITTGGSETISQEIPSDRTEDTESNMNSVSEEIGTKVPEEPAVSVPEDPATPESDSKVIGGFLINQSGMICGVSDPELIGTEGYLELPSEGCTGIAAGTFSAGFPSVREVYIPANITCIEEGAFSGLVNAEWFEVETPGEYYTEEGVLFSENGTCLHTFPAGRIGNYKVPSHVSGFCRDAFNNSRLTVIDAKACCLEEVSGVPEYITILMPGAA